MVIVDSQIGMFYTLKLNNIGSIRSPYSFILFPFRSEKLLAAVAESTSALTLLEPDVSSPKELLGTTSSEGSMNDNPQSVLHNTTHGSPPSASSSELVPDVYIRKDRRGSFCMYPNLGGPFQSICEADDAIERYLGEFRQKAM